MIHSLFFFFCSCILINPKIKESKLLLRISLWYLFHYIFFFFFSHVNQLLIKQNCLIISSVLNTLPIQHFVFSIIHFLTFSLYLHLFIIQKRCPNCQIHKNILLFILFYKFIFSLQPCEPATHQIKLTDKKFGVEYIANPRKKVDPLTIKWLIENTQNQYNLVCNVLMEVCGCNDNEKLNDIAILCCEFTAQCPSLSSEWMGAFAALCNAPVDYGYQVCTFIL